MAAPQDGYPGQAYAPQDPYAQQSPAQPGFEELPISPQLQGGNPGVDTGKKKKRGYATQAYDFGQGANSALGGQTHGTAQFQPAQAAAAYGGYQAQPDPAAAYGAPQAGMVGAPQGGFAQPQYGGGVGGYQPPDAGYPGPGAPLTPGVAGITQGMGQMGMGGSQQPIAAQARPGAPSQIALNQLYPTDLINQPFNVAELDLPPPLIVLPANVSLNICFVGCYANLRIVECYPFSTCQLPTKIC